MDPASSERSRFREAMADVPQKPSRSHCCNGFLHRPNAHVWCSVLLFRHRPRPAEFCTESIIVFAPTPPEPPRFGPRLKFGRTTIPSRKDTRRKRAAGE